MAEINEIRVRIGNYGYYNAVEPTLKQSLAARGIAWDRARGGQVAGRRDRSCQGCRVEGSLSAGGLP